MTSFFKRHRDVILVAALLLYPLVMFLTTGNRTRGTNLLDRAVLASSSPVQRILTGTVEGASGLWSHYVSLRRVQRENDSLREENGRLRGEVNGFEEARTENERLKRMLSYSEANPGIKVPARVLGVSPDAMRQWVRIDKGENDGVKRGMAVVTPDGVVGQVMRATASAADVMLLNDSSSRMGVRVQRTRQRATAAGAGEGVLRLDNLLRSENLEEGDQVITSGLDGVYPPGLVVGRVTAVQRTSGGLFWTAGVIPAVDPSKLEDIFILPSSELPGAADLSQLSLPAGGKGPGHR